MPKALFRQSRKNAKFQIEKDPDLSARLFKIQGFGKKLSILLSDSTCRVFSQSTALPNPAAFIGDAEQALFLALGKTLTGF
ncbi:MAG: hypothetical protein J5I94_22120 [Phaeodactylibacter sp.]|nr:hypothetical protein [Phaeodactylibacter sp.]